MGFSNTSDQNTLERELSPGKEFVRKGKKEGLDGYVTEQYHNIRIDERDSFGLRREDEKGVPSEERN
jgi:hypothetical protein